MPGWFTGVAGTFVLSLVSAYVFLRLRCRGTGDPFGRRAKWWALAIIIETALVSTGAGVLAIMISNHVRAAFLGLVIPSGLWLGQVTTQRGRRGVAPLRALAGCVAFPFRRLYDRMGDDMQDWCDARRDAASRTPQRVAEAAQYYYNQVAARLRNGPAREQLSRRRESIEHKISIVRLISLDTTPARLHAALQWHPSTRDSGKYSADDLPRLSSRLENEARNELHLLLAQVYRLGFHNLLIYPLRAAAQVHTSRSPLADRKATAE